MIENNLIEEPMFFKQSKPASIRLWHWLTFLFFLVSISTVVFGSTLFKTSNNISLVEDQVKEKGGEITKDQARGVAHEFSDKLWMLHKYLGYGLSILLIWRILIEISLSKEKKISTRIKNAIQFKGVNDEKKHYLWVQYGYVFFYLIFFIMSLTGLILAYEDVKWLDPFHEPAGKIHEIVQYGLYAYVVFHIGGVIRYDLTKYGGIVSRMINGKSEL